MLELSQLPYQVALFLEQPSIGWNVGLMLAKLSCSGDLRFVMVQNHVLCYAETETRSPKKGRPYGRRLRFESPFSKYYANGPGRLGRKPLFEPLMGARG